MTVETAQPLAAETDPVAAASAAFKAQREPAPKPREENGRFAAAEAVEEEIEEIADEGEPLEASDDETVETDEQEAEEAQPAADMPASWSKEDGELWQSLPPEAQARIAEREGQRDAAVNSKFQETANARKAAEAQLAEANANRNNYVAAIDQVLSLVAPQRPDPRQYGYGTSDYNRDGYEYARIQYEEQSQIVGQLQAQREEINAQRQTEAEQAERQAYEEVETKARPLLMKDVPELSDPQKAPQAINAIVQYAVQQGIPAETFSNPDVAKRVTSAEMHMAWKAMQYDRIREAKGNIAPKPKPAQPPIRPGVTTTRQSLRQTKFNKDMDRLAKTGSIEDGASIFRHMRQG